MTPDHVSSRYHQSQRNQFICKGTVVPIDGAKLMAFFCRNWLGACWSRWAGLSIRVDVQPSKKGWSDGGFAGRLSDAYVNFLRGEKQRPTVDGFVIAYLSSVELLDIYRG